MFEKNSVNPEITCVFNFSGVDGTLPCKGQESLQEAHDQLILGQEPCFGNIPVSVHDVQLNIVQIVFVKEGYFNLLKLQFWDIYLTFYIQICL